ncbi:MAG: hypothetical protein ACP5VE_09740 [Chthonomonadales bacterium]
MSTTQPAAAQDTALWSSGLKIAGTRNLTPDECACLRRRAFLFAAQGGGALAAVFLGLAAPFVLFLLVPAPASGTIPGTLIIVSWTVALAAGMAAARTSIIRAAQLHRDAACGIAHLFQGPAADIATERLLRILTRQNLLTPASEDAQTIEVLPHSTFVWRVNGQAPKGWFLSPIVRLAEVPAFAALAAEWVQAGEMGLGNRARSGMRDLSAAEIQEIHRHAGTMIARPLGPALLFTAASLTLLWIHNGRIPPALAGPFAWIVSIACLAVLILALSAATAFQYRRDASFGRVLILRYVLEKEPGETSAEQVSPPVEVLPFSRAPWTDDGRPARWRRSAGR